jgi:hypothetical protein
MMEWMDNSKQLLLLETEHWKHEYNIETGNLEVSDKLAELRQSAKNGEEAVKEYYHKLMDQLDLKAKMEPAQDGAEGDPFRGDKLKSDLQVCTKRVELYMQELLKVFKEYRDISLDLRDEELSLFGPYKENLKKIQRPSVPVTIVEEPTQSKPLSSRESTIMSSIVDSYAETLARKARTPSLQSGELSSMIRAQSPTSARSNSPGQKEIPQVLPRPSSPIRVNPVVPPDMSQLTISSSPTSQSRPGISFAFNPVHQYPSPTANDKSVLPPRRPSSPAKNVSLGSTISISTEEYNTLLNRIELLSKDLLKEGIDKLYIDVATQLATSRAQNQTLVKKLEEMSVVPSSSVDDIGWRRYWITKLQTQIVMIEMGLQSMPPEDNARMVQERLREQLLKISQSLKDDGVPLNSVGTPIKKPPADPELRSKLITLTQQVNTEKSENNRLKKKIELTEQQYMNQIHELQSKLVSSVNSAASEGEAEKKYIQICQDFNQLSEKMEEMKEQHAARVQQLQTSMALVAQEKSKVEQEATIYCEKVHNEYKQLEMKYTAIQAKLSDITLQYDSAKKKVDELQRERDVWKEECIQTQKQVDELNEQLASQQDEHEEEKDELHSRLTSLEKQVDLMNQALIESQTKLLESASAADSQISELLHEVARLRQGRDSGSPTQSNAHYKKIITSMQAQLEQRLAELTMLNDTKRILESKNDSLEKALREAQKNHRLSGEPENANKVLQLETELQNAKQRIEVQNNKMMNLQTMYDQLVERSNHSSNDQNVSDLAKANAKIKELTEQLKSEKNNVQILMKTLDDVSNSGWW